MLSRASWLFTCALLAEPIFAADKPRSIDSIIAEAKAHPHKDFSAQNVRIGEVSQSLSPDLSWCLHCKTTWRFVKKHITEYMPGRGCFPLCKKCWEELETPKARLPFYHQMWMEWGAESSLKEWQEIMNAVMVKGL